MKYVETPFGRFYKAGVIYGLNSENELIHQGEEEFGNLYAYLVGKLYANFKRNTKRWDRVGVTEHNILKIINESCFRDGKLELGLVYANNIVKSETVRVCLSYIGATKDMDMENHYKDAYLAVMVETLDENGNGTGNVEYMYCML